MDPYGLRDLADSIAAVGVLEPVLVRRDPNDSELFELIAGERRCRAARMAGLSEIPARVLKADDETALRIALVENIQREDVNIIDRAHALARYRRLRGLSAEQAARELGMTRRTFYQLRSLDDLPVVIKRGVREAGLTLRHGVALRTLQPWPRHQAALLSETLLWRLRVRDCEQAAIRIKARLLDKPAWDEVTENPVDLVQRVVSDLAEDGKVRRRRVPETPGPTALRRRILGICKAIESARQVHDALPSDPELAAAISRLRKLLDEVA